MARGGMRISEVLKPIPEDINGRRLTLRNPKGGREQEYVLSLKSFQIGSEITLMATQNRPPVAT